jgi:hypothetical protein
MSKISVSLGFTRNIGDFNSAKVEIGGEDEVLDGETVAQARQRLYSEIEDELMLRLDEVVGQIKKRTGK